MGHLLFFKEIFLGASDIKLLANEKSATKGVRLYVLAVHCHVIKSYDCFGESELGRKAHFVLVLVFLNCIRGSGKEQLRPMTSPRLCAEHCAKRSKSWG